MTDSDPSTDIVQPQYTPGPWTVEIIDSDAVASGYITGHVISPLHTYAGNTRSRRDSVTDPNSMTWADAHLIAAAPAMLEALAWAVDWLDAYEGECMPEWREWADRARAALAAATSPLEPGS